MLKTFTLLLFVFAPSFANAVPTSEVGRLVWNQCKACEGYYVYWADIEIGFADERRYKLTKPDITSLMIKDITNYSQERCFSMTTYRGDMESNFCEEKCILEGVDGFKVQLIFEMEVKDVRP